MVRFAKYNVIFDRHIVLFCTVDTNTAMEKEYIDGQTQGWKRILKTSAIAASKISFNSVLCSVLHKKEKTGCRTLVWY